MPVCFIAGGRGGWAAGFPVSMGACNPVGQWHDNTKERKAKATVIRDSGTQHHHPPIRIRALRQNKNERALLKRIAGGYHRRSQVKVKGISATPLIFLAPSFFF